MSTMFSSIEEAKAHAAALAGVDPSIFEPVPDLHVGGLDTTLLDDPDYPEEDKVKIRERLAVQQGFKFKVPAGEARIVIGPFRNGYDLWILTPSGAAVRV